MQKYVDLKDQGTNLQIISVFAVDHVKGFIYIEAEKQSGIYEVAFYFSSQLLLLPCSVWFVTMLRCSKSLDNYEGYTHNML